MENSTKPTRPTRNVIGGAILVLLLVVLPAVSWLYLRGGVTWRKQAVAELASWGQVRTAPVIVPNGQKLDLIKGKVCVLYYFGENPDLTETNRRVLDTGQDLIRQFAIKEDGQVMTDYFRMVMIATGGTAEFKSHAQLLPDADSGAWVWNGALGSWRTILVNGYESFTKAEGISPVENYYALADTAGVIRRFYAVDDEEQVNRLRQHIAILLPSQ
jgi:hypothetical protein